MAKLPIDVHSDAVLEEDEAFNWYIERSRRAAGAFLQEEEARIAIQDSPDSWGEYLHGTRHYLLKRFPYIIVYRVTKDRIEIIAVAHGRPKPGYWTNRLKPSD